MSDDYLQLFKQKELMMRAIKLTPLMPGCPRAGSTVPARAGGGYSPGVKKACVHPLINRTRKHEVGDET